MKKLFLLVLVCALVLPLFSTASAAQQLYGETIQNGSVSGYVFNETQAGANFSNIHACLEFCLYALSDTEKNSVYIRNDVYYSFSNGGYLTRCGRAEFSSPLAAAGEHFFPDVNTYFRVVSNETFGINNTLYYRTVLSTNMPSSINGSYHGWISTTASGN